MEWMIMNCDGVKGLCGSLGDNVLGSYQAADDCYETLTALIENLQEEDPIDRSTRRQLAASHLIQQDLVPLLTDVEDNPELFQLGVRLLVSLTQPVECLQQAKRGESKNQQGEPPWVWDVNTMLMEAKTSCSDIKFIKAVFSEIQKILEDAGEYDLVEEDCESINQCLLMIRNLLYIQDIRQGRDCLSGVHMVFLRNLFQCGIDKVLLFLLNAKQKDFWGVTLVQLISLLYRDLVSEIFVRIEDLSSCGEESCDSSNCSHCEAAMDRPFPFDPSFRHSPTKHNSCESSGNVSPDFTKNTVSCSTESKTMILSEQNDIESRTTSPLALCFQDSCQIDQNSEYLWQHEECTTDSCVQCTGNQDKDMTKVDHTLGSCSSGTLKRTGLNSRLESASADNKSTDSSSPLDELGSQLTEFTFNFLQNGFSSLVSVLKQSLMNHPDGIIPESLDDSYFLWSVAFFLKFARRKEIDFKKIKNVFTVEVFGFLVFEAISNGEDVLLSYKNNKNYALSMRRLHLSVSALRELIKTLTFHRERGLEKSDLQYLEELQRNLANMTDLREVFLWLVRMYQPDCHNILFLRDVIVTNHYFLLLLEEWIGRDLCQDKRIDMLAHVKQFAETVVMQKYGYLLQNFVRNDHHVNNCIFTMMHHVAGDCQKPEALLQADILKTFLQIWDTEVPITQEMNDLMEYIIHNFLSTAEENPLSCAMQLFTENPNTQEGMNVDGNDSEESDDDEWTEEEIDKVFMWYAELEGCSDMVDKITIMFSEIGIRKSKLEVVNHMVKMGWLDSEQLETFIDTDKQELDIESPKLNIGDKKQKKMISILEELSRMKEEQVVPHCIQKLKEDGFESQLNFIQANFLEAAYVKIDGEFMQKKYIEEPLFKYCLGKGKDLPIVFYNEEQEKIRDNVYMLAMLQQMGLRLEEETGLLYPRIPSNMTIQELVDFARMLGKIDMEHVKFDIDTASKHISMTTKNSERLPFSELNSRADQLGRKSVTKVPGVAWMDLVANFNKAEANAAYVNAMSLNMDTE
ncbi:protein timeless-like [Mercenaria mercenaria]|uniref:protein timeless-like n=1 Tax=Mercenaria mercenaria TaxID=6596 RepID=UPI00234F1FF3|nr:protein timeless-like [Mercenaria mercenaria]XP_045199745.2 protein timeless-like [Mercenaria mercenaria]XP_053404558.1 protein timeless-like [Mercenaria mercenaria]